MRGRVYKTNENKKGYGVAKIPLYINNINTGEVVIYMGDLPNEHFEVVTNKTFYYDIDLRKQYIIVEDNRITINDIIKASKYINENYYR